jgi:2-polyprenyl-3-methyl-5-hydroxy-6-metoxy-1,4-benzoquinol methylase
VREDGEDIQVLHFYGKGEFSMDELHSETHEAWEVNAAAWDTKMGDEGNDFFRILCWPAMLDLLNLRQGQRVLDIGCGNGLTSRKLAELGAEVTAFDFSANLIALAKQRQTAYLSQITYHVADATDETALLQWGESAFDDAFANMVLFDIANIEPLFRALPKLLKPGGVFVCSITHPAFNNSSAVHVAEESDDEGRMKTVFSIKVSRYMTPYAAHGLALRSQPKPQVYFERPLQYYLNLAFCSGFVLDGFAERAFPPETPQSFPLSWGGNFSEIPPVMVLRMRRL